MFFLSPSTLTLVTVLSLSLSLSLSLDGDGDEDENGYACWLMLFYPRTLALPPPHPHGSFMISPSK